MTKQPEKVFHPMDVIHTHDVSLGLVLLGPLEIPYFHDCVASQAAFSAMDITDPKEWADTFTGYVCMDLIKQDYFIAARKNMTAYDQGMCDGYIPFDHGTGSLRMNLGLVKMAMKWYKKPVKNVRVVLEEQDNKEESND